jgi:hypothetical protein
MFNTFFFRNSCRLGDNAEEYGGAGEPRDDTNRAHAHCMPGSESYEHIQNVKYLLLMHCNSGLENAPVLRYTYIASLVKVLILVWF